MSRTSLMLTAIAMTALAGCSTPKVTERAVATATASAVSPAARLLAKPSHCRLGNTAKQLWPIFAISLTDLETGPDSNWHILRDHNLYPTNPAITIDEKDRFKITDGATAGELTLVHMRPKSGKYDEIARAKIELDGSLWAKGRAVSKATGTEVGDYFLFRIPDNYNNRSGKCGHPNNKATNCASIHIEYFQFGDKPNEKFRPAVGTTVKQIAGTVTCKKVYFETDDGDGDIGPDH